MNAERQSADSRTAESASGRCLLPEGTSGYGEISLNKVIFDLDGQMIPVASLEDIIRSKEAAKRPKDVAHLPALHRLQELRGRQQGWNDPGP